MEAAVGAGRQGLQAPDALEDPAAHDAQADEPATGFRHSLKTVSWMASGCAPVELEYVPDEQGEQAVAPVSAPARNQVSVWVQMRFGLKIRAPLALICCALQRAMELRVGDDDLILMYAD